MSTEKKLSISLESIIGITNLGRPDAPIGDISLGDPTPFNSRLTRRGYRRGRHRFWR